MSKTFKALLFRVNASEPEWIDLCPSKKREILQCKMLELFSISPRLGLWLDEEGRIAGKPVNKCIAKYAPCKDYTDFRGDVLLIANNDDNEDDDDAGESKEEYTDVTEAELLSLKEILAADLKQRDEFNGQYDFDVRFG